MPNSTGNGFYALLPDDYLDAVEAALEGVRATGRVIPLNSVENRVVEIEMEERSPIVAKFYRPNRWSLEQILEEHDFLNALEESEVAVAKPIPLQGAVRGNNTDLNTLGLISKSESKIYFALFEKKRGRHLDEWSDAELKQAGRYLARIHAVGKRLQSHKRVYRRLSLTTSTYGWEALTRLKADGRFDESGWGQRYLAIIEQTISTIESKYRVLKESGAIYQLVHGDCHFGNLMWGYGEPQKTRERSWDLDAKIPYFLDFDDCVFAPPVQDIWMMTRGRDAVANAQREAILEGYELMQPFDWDTLKLIEPLRALRMVHFAGWIVNRWTDPSFPRLFPDFASERWIQSESEALNEILALI